MYRYVHGDWLKICNWGCCRQLLLMQMGGMMLGTLLIICMTFFLWWIATMFLLVLEVKVAFCLMVPSFQMLGVIFPLLTRCVCLIRNCSTKNRLNQLFNPEILYCLVMSSNVTGRVHGRWLQIQTRSTAGPRWTSRCKYKLWHTQGFTSSGTK